jgi:hypothetical protein
MTVTNRNVFALLIVASAWTSLRTAFVVCADARAPLAFSSTNRNQYTTPEQPSMGLLDARSQRDTTHIAKGGKGAKSSARSGSRNTQAKRGVFGSVSDASR